MSLSPALLRTSAMGPLMLVALGRRMTSAEGSYLRMAGEEGMELFWCGVLYGMQLLHAWDGIVRCVHVCR